MYDVYQIRKDFPILAEKVNGKPVAFLDTAASAQKPTVVLDKMREVYTKAYANPHRGSYFFAEEITTAFENARVEVQKFIHAATAKEIVFTRNATESINLVAATWGAKNLHTGDEVLISEAEHHANLVPWQHICEVTGARLKVFAVSDEGDFVEENFEKALTDKTKLVAVTAMSNVLGTIFPIKKMTQKAHEAGALLLADACQYAAHNPIDVQDWDCDFLAFSGHKTYGPTGIGILYGKAAILQDMPPYQFGGDMIDNVTFAKTTYADIPARFEAGTAASVQAIGMAEGLKYMQNIGFESIITYENKLKTYTLNLLEQVPNLHIVGVAKERGGVFSFDVKGIHPQDLAFVLNKENVAVRIGHHCAQPIVNRMGYTSLARASFGLYTSKEDIDALFAALIKAEKFFRENQ